MERKKTMAPKTMLPGKMVPYTMGTLDRKSLGLTSSTIMARLFCGDGKTNRQRAGRTRPGGQRAPLRTAPAMIQRAGDGATADHLRVGRLKGSWSEGNKSPESFGRWAEAQACAGGGGVGPLVWTQERVPSSPIAHQTIGIIMKACTESVVLSENRVQGRRGAGHRVIFARRACARVRAWKAYVCACVRAVRRSGQGGSPSPRQVGPSISTAICSSTFYLSGELIPTESEENLCYRRKGVAGSPFVHDSIIICTISSLL